MLQQQGLKLVTIDTNFKNKISLWITPLECLQWWYCMCLNFGWQEWVNFSNWLQYPWCIISIYTVNYGNKDHMDGINSFQEELPWCGRKSTSLSNIGTKQKFHRWYFVSQKQRDLDGGKIGREWLLLPSDYNFEWKTLILHCTSIPTLKWQVSVLGGVHCDKCQAHMHFGTLYTHQLKNSTKKSKIWFLSWYVMSINSQQPMKFNDPETTNTI